MSRLIRFIVYAFASYFYFRIGFPDADAKIYHLLAPMFLIAAACLTHFLLHMVESGLGRGIWACELLFIAFVIGFMAFTLPQNNGVPPYRQWLDNGRPTNSTASAGLSKLGLDPHSQIGQLVLKAFP